MKKITAILLILTVVLSVCACGTQTPQTTEAPTEPAQPDYTAGEADISQLEKLYEGRNPYQGEFHDHANTGGTSDGKMSLEDWKMNLLVNDMDFATIADHRQVLHMRLPEWDNNLFIGGTEAATTITDSQATQNNLHYNMLFSAPEQLETVLNTFPLKFAFFQDHFSYLSFTTEEFEALAKFVTENGGFFVHVHPKGKSYMQSDNPLDYCFGDYTGIEVLCGYYGNMTAEENQDALKLWTDLLALGKKVYATSGSDSHNASNTVSLTTIYAEKSDAETYLNRVRRGDFTAGPVGIRMSIGDTCTGGTTDFQGKRLVVSVGEFHSRECMPGHTYRIDIYSDQGLVASREIPGTGTSYMALDADDSVKFYRAEVYDVTSQYQVAIGNPIWNEG